MLENFLGNLKKWYDNADLRVLFSISLIMLLVFSGFLYTNRQSTGQWFEKGLDLKGGKQLSVSLAATDRRIMPEQLEANLRDRGVESAVRKTTSATTTELLIKVPPDVNETQLLDALEEEDVDTSGHSFNQVSASLAETFWKQSQLALTVAFIFMGVVVLIVYKDLVPSIAIIFAAFTDIICTLSIMQILNIPLSLASFAGLLLVIGYSIDSDIVLTARVLKRRKGSVSERTFSAMKTSLTMTITTLSALAVLYIATSAQALRDVATVLIIALLIDLVATWFGNASILRWWVER